MVVRIQEKSVAEIDKKIREMTTSLNKIAYLESAIKFNFSFDIKRFIWEKLSTLYEEKKLYDKAAKAMVGKALIDISFRDKMESYLKAGEFFAKAGKIEDSEHIFTKAIREAQTQEEKLKIKLAMKNIFLTIAKELEKSSKKVNASYFYKKILEMPITESEKQQIKEKLRIIYKSLGKFREAELLEGI
ncbi:MAG: hypothetical protein ACOYT4_04055 [Nanoarchaeota archaeon]